MKKIALSLLLVAVTLITSCSEQKTGQKDYFIFGSFYGMCLGFDCVRYYKIENGVLYTDALKRYPGGGNSNTYQFNAYNGVYHNALLNLSASLPANIYNEPESIGAPDASDQGGYYIEVHSNGHTNQWKIDKNQQAVPTYLHAMCDSMDHYLQVLN